MIQLKAPIGLYALDDKEVSHALDDTKKKNAFIVGNSMDRFVDFRDDGGMCVSIEAV